jgi:hypothetical protein
MFLQWISIPFAFTHKAVGDITVNATATWVKELDPVYIGLYLDSYLLLIFGGIPWQVSTFIYFKVYKTAMVYLISVEFLSIF